MWSFLFSFSLFLIIIIFCASSHASPYMPDGSGLLMNIVSPSSLIGSVSFVPIIGSPPLSSSLSSFSLSGVSSPLPLLFPNSLDSSTGCDPNTGRPLPFLFTNDDAGRPLNGSVLALYPDACTPIVSNLGVVAVFYLNPGLPISIPKFHSPLSCFGFAPVYQSDQDYLTSYMTSNTNINQTLMVTLTGSGQLDSDERAVLTNLAAQFNVTREATTATFGASFLPLASSSLSDPSYDPCTSPFPLGGVYCELGHVVGIYWNKLNLYGSAFDLQSLPYLRHIELHQNNIRGPLTNNDVVWPGLVVLDIGYSSVTSLPTSLFGVQSRLAFLDARFNMIANIPTTLNDTTTLVWVTLLNNQIPSFPYLGSLINLQYLDLSNNNATIQMFDFRKMPSLQNLFLSKNVGIGCISAEWFDNMFYLEGLFLSSMNLCGVLPTLKNAVSLISLELAYNQLTGVVPTQWAELTTLVLIDLSYNQVQIHGSPFPSFVSNLYLGSNNISFHGSSVCSFMLSFVPTSVSLLNLDNNDIGGQFYAAECQTFSFLNNFSMSHTLVENIPPDLFGSTFPGIYYLDLSFSRLNGSLPLLSPPPTVLFLSFAGNPSFVGSLPPWLSVSDSVLSTLPTTPNLLCGKVTTTVPGMQIQLDPTYYNFQGCQCFNGYYGAPSDCRSIPYLISLSDSENLFTDSNFGNQRYSSGLDSSWFISPGLSTRFLTFNVTVFPSFNQFTDELTFYDGTSASAPVVMTFAGGELPQNSIFRVINEHAFVNFRSKATDGTHFIVQYTQSTYCPDGYSDVAGKCQLINAPNTLYIAIFSASLIFVIALIFSFAYVVHRNMSLKRKLSKPELRKVATEEKWRSGLVKDMAKEGVSTALDVASTVSSFIVMLNLINSNVNAISVPFIDGYMISFVTSSAALFISNYFRFKKMKIMFVEWKRGVPTFVDQVDSNSNRKDENGHQKHDKNNDTVSSDERVLRMDNPHIQLASVQREILSLRLTIFSTLFSSLPSFVLNHVLLFSPPSLSHSSAAFSLYSSLFIAYALLGFKASQLIGWRVLVNQRDELIYAITGGRSDRDRGRDQIPQERRGRRRGQGQGQDKALRVIITTADEVDSPSIHPMLLANSSMSPEPPASASSLAIVSTNSNTNVGENVCLHRNETGSRGAGADADGEVSVDEIELSPLHRAESKFSNANLCFDNIALKRFSDKLAPLGLESEFCQLLNDLINSKVHSERNTRPVTHYRVDTISTNERRD